MQPAERLSRKDGTLLAGYAESVERLRFALPYCAGQRVLDAGCGSGFGTHYLASHGAASAIGIDVSTEAIEEANEHFSFRGVKYVTGNLQQLDAEARALGRFGAIVSFETLPHLEDPQPFLKAASAMLEESGTLVLSTPNRAAIPIDASGKPEYPYQHHAYAADELESVLRPHFRSVHVWGQWLSAVGQLRKAREYTQFQYLCDSYYQPAARLSRALRRALGKPTLPPPQYTADADAYPGDFEIAPIDAPPVPWEPLILIAVCSHRP